MGLSQGASSFKKQIDTFTTTGNGVLVDISTNPFSNFSLSVIPTGPVVTWIVILEGSLDGINFTTITTHTNNLGAVTMFPGVNITPCLYFRTRCSALALGLGTNIIATVLGNK